MHTKYIYDYKYGKLKPKQIEHKHKVGKIYIKTYLRVWESFERMIKIKRLRSKISHPF